MAQVKTYSVPVLENGVFVGYRQIKGDLQPGNGSRNARCISVDNSAPRKGYWGRKKL